MLLLLCANVAAAMCKYHHQSANVLILFVMAADTVYKRCCHCLYVARLEPNVPA